MYSCLLITSTYTACLSHFHGDESWFTTSRRWPLRYIGTKKWKCRIGLAYSLSYLALVNSDLLNYARSRQFSSVNFKLNVNKVYGALERHSHFENHRRTFLAAYIRRLTIGFTYIQRRMDRVTSQDDANAVFEQIGFVPQRHLYRTCSRLCHISKL